MRKILRFIGELLLFVVLVTIFLIIAIIASALTLGVILLLFHIGKWVGIDKDIFIYSVWFVVFLKAWDFLVWIVEKIVLKKD